MNHLVSLQEIHTLSSEIQAKRLVLRERIRNADDTIIDTLINVLINASSAAPEVKAKPSKASKKEVKKQAKAKKGLKPVGPDNACSLILQVLGKTPMGPAEIHGLMVERKLKLNSSNPKVYIGWVLGEYSKGKGACFRRVDRGKYVPRKVSAPKQMGKAGKIKVISSVPAYLGEPLTQKVLTGLLDGPDTFQTPEFAARIKVNGRSLANIFAKLRGMKLLKKAGKEWKVVERTGLRALLKKSPVVAVKTNGHHTNGVTAAAASN